MSWFLPCLSSLTERQIRPQVTSTMTNHAVAEWQLFSSKWKKTSRKCHCSHIEVFWQNKASDTTTVSQQMPFIKTSIWETCFKHKIFSKALIINRDLGADCILCFPSLYIWNYFDYISVGESKQLWTELMVQNTFKCELENLCAIAM